MEVARDGGRGALNATIPNGTGSTETHQVPVGPDQTMHLGTNSMMYDKKLPHVHVSAVDDYFDVRNRNDVKSKRT